MTICNTCNSEKDDSLFPQWNGRRSGRKCNACRAATQRVRVTTEPGYHELLNKRARESMERRRADPNTYERMIRGDRLANRTPKRDAQMRIAQSKADKKRNPARRAYMKKKQHEHYVANRHAYMARYIARKTNIKRATFEGSHASTAIREFYLNCPADFHVDHIVPLKNSSVCGLHVIWNLQYLPATDNLRKRNHFVRSKYEDWIAGGQVGLFLN